MRIVSLLPAATEIVCAIGLESELVAITSGCDWPPSIVGTPVVTRDRGEATGSSGSTEASVSDAMHGGAAVLGLDHEALAAAHPDLILAQERCRACGVDYGTVSDVARRIDPAITVISLEPTSIEGILNAISTIGAMTESEDAAMDLVASFRERLRAIEDKVTERREEGHRGPRVVALGEVDPPYTAGHWIPEQIRRAGGWDVLGIDGGPASPMSWERIIEVSPEILLVVPNDLHLADTVARWERTPIPEDVGMMPAVRAGAVLALDGAAYFSRPSPRIIDGIELLAEVMDPPAFTDLAPGDGWVPVDLPQS